MDWVHAQPLAATGFCLGDGHDGIWNLFSAIAVPEQRREILEGYHLVENLHKIGGSINRLNQIEALLWQGKVDESIQYLTDCNLETAKNFIQYLTKHQNRIPNYHYLQLEGFTMLFEPAKLNGSGGVESGIKQISRRIKISGAQWSEKNVNQVLQHRCAYLNGQFSVGVSPSIHA